MDKNKMLTVKIENEFVMKAHYSLSATEQKIVLYLASRINPQKDAEFHQQVVPIKKLEKLLSGENTKRWGSVYGYLKEVCDRLLNQKIKFNKPVLINGKEKIIGGGLNWFQHILITENEQKEKSIEFMFSSMMKPFLLELNRYVKLDTLEVMNLRGKYAVRMYQVFKTERERTKKHMQQSIVSYGLDEFKAFLGVSGKYSKLANFRCRVLDPITTEINSYSKEIEVGFKYLKTQRRVTGIEFNIWDKPKEESLPKKKNEAQAQTKDFIPSEKDIKKLSNAKHLAYFILVEYGVKQGIAYRQIVPSIKAGEADGFEDIFVKSALEYFDKKTKMKTKDAKAGAFVKWWTEREVFSHEKELYWLINERVYKYKKGLSVERRNNRLLAKDKTREVFLGLIAADKE